MESTRTPGYRLRQEWFCRALTDGLPTAMMEKMWIDELDQAVKDADKALKTPDGTIRIWDSVSPLERGRQIQEAEKLRREAEPLVDRLLAELADPLDVADHLRADDTLSDSLRRAALRVLLKRSMASRPNQP